MKKKTKTERNREAKLKAEATRIRLIESEKKARQELMHIKGMSRAVQAELAIKNAASEERRTAKKRSQIQTLKRLGKVAFTPAPIAVQIPEELSDSLRQMKTEGNLVMDRFKSLQERALIEPVTGIQRKRQKTKVKLVDPYSYRDFK
jgi:nucleolar protein 53